MSDDSLQDLFRFVLIILGVIYLVLTKTAQESIVTAVLKYPLIVIGTLYVFYKGLTMENSTKQTLYAVSVVLALVLLFGFNYLFTVGECGLEKPCGENQFCATDHLCHEFPEYTNEITKIVISKKISFTLGGMIVGLGLIISALILRNTSFYSRVVKVVKGAFRNLRRFS